MAADVDIQDARISHAASVIPVKSENSVPYLDFRQLTAMTRFMAEVFHGSVVGTGAALEVPCPFDPAAVEIINETKLASVSKTPSMPVGDSFLRVTAGTMSKLATTAGITLGAKGERKFTLGDNAQLNSNADVIHFTAYGSRGVGGAA